MFNRYQSDFLRDFLADFISDSYDNIQEFESALEEQDDEVLFDIFTEELKDLKYKHVMAKEVLKIIKANI